MREDAPTYPMSLDKTTRLQIERTRPRRDIPELRMWGWACQSQMYRHASRYDRSPRGRSPIDVSRETSLTFVDEVGAQLRQLHDKKFCCARFWRVARK